MKPVSFSRFQKVQNHQFFAEPWLEKISKTVLYFNLLALKTYSAPLFEGIDDDAEPNPEPPNRDVPVEAVGFEGLVPKAKRGLEPESPKVEDEVAVAGPLAAEVIPENKPVPPTVPAAEVVVEEPKRPDPVLPVSFDDVEVDKSMGLAGKRPWEVEILLDGAPNGVELADRFPNKPPPAELLIGA